MGDETYTLAIDRSERESSVPARAIRRETSPARIDRYRVLRTLGHGGQGVVYEAHDPELDRNVAIKFMRAGTATRHATRRLLREATALAQLSHPNVVGVHDVGQCDDGVYIVTQLVEGITLCEWLRVHRTWREIVRVFAAAGRGLVAAHERAIIHRDFKPANVLVDGDGVARLVDFGLARDAAHDRDTSSSGAHCWDSASHALTLDGYVMGTPSYMAPEQHEGAPANAAADQYAFCVALFEALWKQRPFVARDVAALAAEKRAYALPFPRHDPIPVRLRTIVATGLQPDAERRWSSMRELVAALERAVSPRRRVTRWVAAVGVLAIAVGVGVYGERDPACGAADAWAEVWSIPRASALASAFAGTGRRYADDAAARVRTGVDTFGAAWIAEREAACDAIDADPHADARLACLDARLDELTAALTVLEQDTPDAIERAVETIGALPSPHRCAQPELEAPPRDVARSVTRARQTIARADALQRAGRYDDALAETDRARELARDHAPTIAAAALSRSSILQGMGAYADGREQAQHAYFTAHADGHDELAFRAAFSLALSARLVGSSDADARAWAHRAEGTLARLGDDADPKLPGVLAYMFAALALQTGDYEAALEHAREATAILEHELGSADHRVTATMVAATTALVSLHRLEEAEVEAHRTIASAEAAVGPAHPFTADALILLALVQQQRGAFEDALAIQRRVLEIQEAALDPESPALATTWMNIGNVESELGHAEASEQALRRALEISRASLGPDNAALVGILHNLALTLSSRGKRDEAIATWREALDLGRRQLGPDHPGVGDVLASLGEALADAGRVDEAEPMIEHALAIRRRAL